MYEIKKGVPIPPKWPNTVHPKYPLLEMEVWDSFFVELKGEDAIVIQRRLCAAAHKATKYTGRLFTTRVCEGTVGVWRLPDADTPVEPTHAQEPVETNPPQPVVVNLRKQR